uniref:Cytochrome b6/f complex subunit VI n=1 Tax=Lepidodinium chlorophorum TaxID=107758 RepID=A0A0F7R555_LEPCH|nr:cytochrome b6/f complex subunit VI [Lepidodinium chlorophorum]BAR72319.1 cytochrome b6/f complex subunit VI [Lepidodinium chlorophorum]
MFTIINYISFVRFRIGITAIIYFRLLKIRLILYGRTTFVGNCTWFDSRCYFWTFYDSLSPISSKGPIINNKNKCIFFVIG